MKPKPFWPLNHLTVPLFMGALPFRLRVLLSRAQTQPVCFEFWRNRQSGALFAARPIRSAESSICVYSVVIRVSQAERAVRRRFTRKDWLFGEQSPILRHHRLMISGADG